MSLELQNSIKGPVPESTGCGREGCSRYEGCSGLLGVRGLLYPKRSEIL